MYELIYSPTALKSLEKFDKPTQLRIITALERLRIRPESCDFKKLIGMKCYRFRIGDYRVIFDLDNENSNISILKIAHRKNVYE